MPQEPTWDDLVNAHGIDPTKVDEYIHAQLKAVYGEPKRTKTRRPRRQRIPFPDRIPTADAMLDEIHEHAGWASIYEVMIFHAWLRLQAQKQGLLEPRRMSFSEFERRYYGDNAPDRLD